MPQEEITPTSAEEIRNKTKALPPIRDQRGPIVYERGQVPSMNGIDPNYMNKDAADDPDATD